MNAVKSYNIHPWSRYFARIFDLTLIAALFWLLSSLFPAIADWLYSGIQKPEEIGGAMMWGGIIIAPFIFFSLAVISETFGSTPGKWALGIHVYKKGGATPSFVDILTRELNVWVRGCAFCVPLISPISILWQYNNLNKNGETTYDRGLGFVVTKHPESGAARVAAFSLALIALLISNTIFWDNTKQELAKKLLQANVNAGYTQPSQSDKLLAEYEEWEKSQAVAAPNQTTQGARQLTMEEFDKELAEEERKAAKQRRYEMEMALYRQYPIFDEKSPQYDAAAFRRLAESYKTNLGNGMPEDLALNEAIKSFSMN